MTEYHSETYNFEVVEEVICSKKENEEEHREERLELDDEALRQIEAGAEKKTFSGQAKEYDNTMEIKQNKNELHLYPINENEYIGAIDVDSDESITAMNQPRTLFLVDASESMGHATERFVKEILPLVMRKFKYDDNHLIDLISFGNESVHTLAHSIEDFVLTNTKLKIEGGTNFGPAIEKLRLRLEYYQRFSTDRLIRVLTISNGTIEDQDNAEKETKKLNDFLGTSELTINSQAVRLFTSDDEPDTKALAYLLQINNTTETRICDLRATESDENIANAIAALFQSDGFQNNQILEFEESIFLKFPWNSLQSTRITLVPGWNSFWLKLIPTGAVQLDESPIKVIIERQLTLAAFHKLMETKLAYIADHRTILKIVGTTEAVGIVDQIFEYFENTEDLLALKCSTPNKKIITNWLDGIAKNKTNFSDSAQMAEFLRMTHRKIERQRQKEKEIREKEISRKKEEQEARREIEVEEGDRIKREMEERIKREVQERIGREFEERIELETKERLKREEVDRVKRLEKERIERIEVERLKREKQRIKREQRVEQEQLVERDQRVEQERVQKIKRNKVEIIAKELLTKDVEITTGTSKSDLIIDRNSVQTVFIINERESRTKKGRRVTEKVIPLMLSKLFHENPQLVHLVTFVRNKTTVEQMLRSLELTLDAEKQIRILVLTDGDSHESQNIEDFCETLTEFLSEANYTFELEVARITSAKKYKLIDIDASESNEAKQIPTQQNFCSFYFLIFIIFFALLFVRYVYNLIFSNLF